MSGSALDRIADEAWFITSPPDGRRDVITRELGLLSPEDLVSVTGKYYECFGAGAPTVTLTELSKFAHAYSLCRYGLDSAHLLPPDLRQLRLEKAASEADLDLDRFHIVRRWSVTRGNTNGDHG